MTPSFTKRRPAPSEEGYILVAVIFMLAILILSMAVAIPRVRDDIRRDREIETMERGKQYVRAVQLYYKKYHRYPPNIDALVKTDNIRFLRKKYIDPTTGKDEWKPVLFGQNKTPQAMGFFGQPLGGAPLAGTGPGGDKGTPGSPGTGGTSSVGGGLFNTGNSGSSTDSGTGSSTSSSGASGTSAGGTDSNGNPTPGSGTSSSGSTSSGTPSSGNPSGTNSPTSPTSGQTFGGAGIIGFSPQSPKQSILVYKKKNHYNEWEFLYSPLMDQQMMSGGRTGATGQQPTSTPNSPQAAPQPTPQ